MIFQALDIKAKVYDAGYLKLPLHLGSLVLFDVLDVVKVQQIVDGENFIGQITEAGTDGSSQTVWFTGYSTGKLVDDETIRPFGTKLFIADGKKTYTTVMGASKTVLIVRECVRSDILR